MTIIDRINEYRNEIIKGDLLPGRAAEIMTELSALLGNCNDQITTCDMAYNKVLLDFMGQEMTAAKARICAGVTPEYKAMREARNAEKTAVELIRSLKYYLKAKEEEYRQGGNF